MKKLTALLPRTKSSSLIAAVLALGPLHPAAAQTIYSTGFEAPALVAGLPLVGQDGWFPGPPFLSPDAAVITSCKGGKACKKHKHCQCVVVEGADLVPEDLIEEISGGYYKSIGSYRHPVDYDTGGSQTVMVSVDVRLDGRATPKLNFFSASVAAIGYNSDGGSEGIGELAISSDGHVYGYSGQDFVPVFLTSTRVALGIWHNLAIEVDFAERTYSFYVDGSWLGTFDFADSATSDVLRRGSIITYAASDTRKDKKADHAASFDNFAIEVVEE